MKRKNKIEFQSCMKSSELCLGKGRKIKEVRFSTTKVRNKIIIEIKLRFFCHFS